MNNNHKYNTRLSSGSLKRKYIECDNNDSSDDEDDFDEVDDSDSENNLKSKSDYYKLLYELYPSKFSKNKYHSQKKLEDFKFDFDPKKII